MNKATAFYQWLIAEKQFDQKKAKKQLSIIKILEEYAGRKGFGFSPMFESSKQETEKCIAKFKQDTFVQRKNSQRHNELLEALALLNDFYCAEKQVKSEIEHSIMPLCSDVRLPKPDSSTKNETDKNKTESTNATQSSFKKLIHRIERDFKRCTYIGDISINDEEYNLLIQFFRHGYDRICNSANHETINPLFAVALVQIGIRFYDGRFWPYVQQELNLEKPLPGYQQSWIGTSFYKTLVKYNKFHVEKSEFMNNILLHCFITNHYANDLFDFLFAYYQIDLDRDLSRNNKEMRNYLMQSMSKGEQSAREYKIKKHTADAVSANARGCKTRVAHILRFMDNALFNDSFPTNSRNRIAQLFCGWAKSSKKFDFEKKRTRGLTHSGEKRFSTPYIHFDTQKEWFCLVFPPQYIHLDDNEELPDITWKIRIGENEQILPANTDNCVTGCKTEKHEYPFQSELLMNEVNIELWKNDTIRIQRFKIKSDTVRFFDSDWDMIDSATYAKYLPVGNAFAFCYPNELLLSDSDAIIDSEKKHGYDLYTLTLEKGDVLRLPNGKAKSVGKPLEEGILSQNLVSGANAFETGEKYPIYNAIPSVYFRMTPVQENGTLIVINGAKYRFDIEKCVRFDMDEETEEKGYIVKLNDLITAGGIYNVMIDVPNSRKERNYLFAFLPAFSYQFENAPYIFQETGIISFPEGSMIRCADSSEHIARFCFDISPDQDELPFVYDAGDRTIDIHISVPVLKWKFNGNEWNIEHPEEIWHKEFPKTIYIKYPLDEITFSMSPIMTETTEEDSDEDEENTFSVTFIKNKGTHLFECDTRKMVSWFGYEEANRILRLELDTRSISFANVITRCFLNGSPAIQENTDLNELIIKSRISGFADCVADVYYGEESIADKQTITTSGIHLKAPFRSGDYRIIFYEWDDEDDDFGFADYRKFDERTVHFDSQYDLSDKIVLIKGTVERQDKTSIFSSAHYDFSSIIKVSNLEADENDQDTYFGNCDIGGRDRLIRITVLNRDRTQALLSYYDEDDEDYFDFLLDKEVNALVISEDETLDARQRKDRYIFLDSEDYFFNIQIR